MSHPAPVGGRGELVSVIVPVYRVESYLEKCVESLLAQTHDNLEIILVNDGSPDRCGEMCDDYAVRDARVRVIHQPNGGPGPSAARNAGLRIARGDYLTFVDSDDWVHEEHVATLLRLVLDHRADIAVCLFVWVHGDEPTLQPTTAETRVWSGVASLALFEGPLATPIAVAWGKLYRRTLFQGITYPEGKTHEDDYTTHLLLGRADRIVMTTAPLYYYRLRAGSIMAEHGQEDLRCQAEALVQRAEYLRAVGHLSVANDQLRKAFNVLRRLQRVLPDDPAVAELITHTARTLRRTGRPWPLRIFAAAYVRAPSTTNRVHDLYGTVKALVRPRPAGHHMAGTSFTYASSACAGPVGKRRPVGR